METIPFMKTMKLLLTLGLSGCLLAGFSGCGDREKNPGEEAVPQREAPAPDQGARPVEGEGKPETNNDPGDSRVDGDSRTSKSLSPSPMDDPPEVREAQEKDGSVGK
jgi:hypothetical protein